MTGETGSIVISDDAVLARLRERFGLDVGAIEFLPLASDADVRGYRVPLRAEISSSRSAAVR